MIPILTILCFPTRCAYAVTFPLPPLLDAIQRSDVHDVRRYASRETVNECFNDSYPLKQAIKMGDYDIVKELLDAGAEANPSSVKDREPPPLFLACLERRTDLVELLLDRGAESSAVFIDIYGNSHDLFGYCILAGAWRACHYLLERPDVVVDVNRKIGGNDGNGFPPLEFCSIIRRYDLVQAMVEKGNANLGAVNNTGRTPLFLTAEDFTGEATKAMLAKGADANYQTASGLTSLHAALQEGNKEMVGILLENGADPNASGPEVMPPALYVLDIIQRERKFYKLKCLKMLLEKADVNLPFGDGTIRDEILRRMSSTRHEDKLEYAPILNDILGPEPLEAEPKVKRRRLGK